MSTSRRRALAARISVSAVFYLLAGSCTDYFEPGVGDAGAPAAVHEETDIPAEVPPAVGGEPRRDAGTPAPSPTKPSEGGPPPDAPGEDATVVTYPIPPALTGGHVYYTWNNHVWRIEARQGATPVNLSTALDRFGQPGTDVRIDSSHDSRYMTLVSSRFGCAGECLVLVPSDLSRVEIVRPGGVEVHPPGISAIQDDLIVYPSEGGPHQIDLFATRRVNGTSRWSAPVLLTGASTYPYNNMPALSLDGTHVTFDCGRLSYPEYGNNDACRVNIDGTGFAKVVGMDALPNARQTHVQNPHEGPNVMLFEAAWEVDAGIGVPVAPEIIWGLPYDGGAPFPWGWRFDNAVSPCTLPDGRYAMLWLGGPGNEFGDHELAVVSADATSAFVLTPHVDVTDIGLGCGD